ncbi:MAG: hypothetical protein SFV81_28970 [Pirellulaceae bacterium]|nr:hypothetical protein [Pirellulaceae bacterium]
MLLATNAWPSRNIPDGVASPILRPQLSTCKVCSTVRPLSCHGAYLETHRSAVQDGGIRSPETRNQVPNLAAEKQSFPKVKSRLQVTADYANISQDLLTV